jgi:hypothetical protein
MLCFYDKNLGICSGRAWSISMNSIIDISCESFCMASLNLMPSPCKRNLQMVLKTQHCQLVHVKVGIIENYVGLRRTKELQAAGRHQGARWWCPTRHSVQLLHSNTLSHGHAAWMSFGVYQNREPESCMVKIITVHLLRRIWGYPPFFDKREWADSWSLLILIENSIII